MTAWETFYGIVTALMSVLGAVAFYAYKHDLRSLKDLAEAAGKKAHDLSKDLQEIREEVARMSERESGTIQRIEDHLESDEKSFDKVDAKLDSIDRKLNELMLYVRRGTPPTGTSNPRSPGRY